MRWTNARVGTAPALTTAFAGAPWWAVFLVVLAVLLVFLASLLLTYREVERLGCQPTGCWACKAPPVTGGDGSIGRAG